jgi:transcription antitermination factor NusG
MAWRAVYCISGQEGLAAKELTALGHSVFYPFERFKRHKAVLGTTQIRWIDQALFPGYIFVESDFIDLEFVQGAISVVRSGLRPLSIPGPVINALQRLADASGLIRSEDLTKNSSQFKGKPGDPIRIVKGPFEGLIAKIHSLSRLDETGEISAWVEAFGGSVKVDFPFTAVKSKVA